MSFYLPNHFIIFYIKKRHTEYRTLHSGKHLCGEERKVLKKWLNVQKIPRPIQRKFSKILVFFFILGYLPITACISLVARFSYAKHGLLKFWDYYFWWNYSFYLEEKWKVFHWLPWWYFWFFACINLMDMFICFI